MIYSWYDLKKLREIIWENVTLEADVTRSNTEKVYHSIGVVGNTETLEALHWPCRWGGMQRAFKRKNKHVLSSPAFKLVTELRWYDLQKWVRLFKKTFTANTLSWDGKSTVEYSKEWIRFYLASVWPIWFVAFDQLVLMGHYSLQYLWLISLHTCQRIVIPQRQNKCIVSQPKQHGHLSVRATQIPDLCHMVAVWLVYSKKTTW